MSSGLTICHARAVLPEGVQDDATVRVSDGLIVAVDAHGAAPLPDSGVTVVDAGGRWLAPGYIDLHLHGLHRHLADDGPDAVAAISRLLPRYGVTGWLPTLCPSLKEAGAAARVSRLSSMPAGGAAVLGLHVEGPFLALAGAVPPEVRGGVTADVLADLIRSVCPRQMVFSVSPEFPNSAGLVSHLRACGAAVFLTHTAADVASTQAAIAAGARHATHFYDVFPALPERDPGVRSCGAVEAILADPRVSVDFILDGVHVDPVAVQMALRCKGADGVCLISDAMVGAGLPPGRYRFGGRDVCFAAPGGPARLAPPDPAAGSLAGSGLTLDAAVRNAVRWLGLDVPAAVRLAGANPARVLGLERKGRLAPGCDADLVLLDDELNVTRTWVAGQCVYTRGANHADV